MLERPMIDRMARLRKLEIAHEVFGLSSEWKRISWAMPKEKVQMDLNIRVGLQPRLSLSIWLGRGVR